MLLFFARVLHGVVGRRNGSAAFALAERCWPAVLPRSMEKRFVPAVNGGIIEDFPRCVDRMRLLSRIDLVLLLLLLLLRLRRLPLLLCCFRRQAMCTQHVV